MHLFKNKSGIQSCYKSEWIAFEMQPVRECYFRVTELNARIWEFPSGKSGVERRQASGFRRPSSLGTTEILGLNQKA
jgi:hypothetical protein